MLIESMKKIKNSVLLMQASQILGYVVQNEELYIFLEFGICSNFCMFRPSILVPQETL